MVGKVGEGEEGYMVRLTSHEYIKFSMQQGLSVLSDCGYAEPNKTVEKYLLA